MRSLLKWLCSPSSRPSTRCSILARRSSGESVGRTFLRRPELLEGRELSAEERDLLREFLAAEIALRAWFPVRGVSYALHPRYLYTHIPGSRRLADAGDGSSAR